MPIVKMTLAEAQARPFTAAERAQLAALAAKPDSAIDFSDQPDITAADIAAGHYRLVGRGGARVGAGRKPTGKLRKTVKLSPAAIRRIEAYARRRGLPDFSAALEEAALTLR